MTIATCSFVLWAMYSSVNAGQVIITEIPSSTHPTLAECKKEVDDSNKQIAMGIKVKGLLISYKCLPDTIDPRK